MYYKKIKKYLKKFDIPLKNVLFEPESKNTLAPIGILSKKINDIDPEAVCAVLPCDHFVKSRNRFLKLLSKGLDIAKVGYIVTLGVPPTRPETGYGYIKISSEISRKNGIPQIAGRAQSSERYYKVDKFIEKPVLKKAKEFLRYDYEKIPTASS